MDRTIYIRQGMNLRCKSLDKHDYEYLSCAGDDHPCIEINVIAEDEERCLTCDRRIDCLVKPQKCSFHVYWHICSGNCSGVYCTPNYLRVGFMRDRECSKVGKDEKKFIELTGLSFDDVVYKLYRI